MKSDVQGSDRLLRTALVLSVITVVYNVAEGLVSTLFGYADDTIALFGFGIDSFVEVISGVGVGHMIWRMRRAPVAERDRFERTALRVTGASFFILAAGLLAGSVLNIIRGTAPETTVPGVIIAAVSIVTMWALYSAKMRVGRALGSDPIIADAGCTKTCLYLSFILLASSLLYELLHIGYLDAAGGLGIAWYAYREGREAMEKARSREFTCSCSEHHDDD